MTAEGWEGRGGESLLRYMYQTRSETEGESLTRITNQRRGGGKKTNPTKKQKKKRKRKISMMSTTKTQQQQ